MPEVYKYPFLSKSAAYATEAHAFVNNGVVARYVSDQLPEGKYINLKNMESRLENALSTRMGTTPITAIGIGGVGAGVQSLARLKGLSSTWRYAKGDDGHIYRRQGDAQGVFTDVDSGYSTAFPGKVSAPTYRPNLSSVPYIFFADKSKMGKDNGTTVSKWGIAAPTRIPTLVVGAVADAIIDDFEVDGIQYDYTNFSAHAAAVQVNTTIAIAIVAPGLQEVTPAAMTNIIVGSYLDIDNGNPNEERVYVTAITANTFTANFTKTHGAAVTVKDSAITGTVLAGGAWITDYIAASILSPSGSGIAEATDTFSLLIWAADAAHLGQLNLTFVSGAGQIASLALGTGLTKAFPDMLDSTWYRVTFQRSDLTYSGGAFDWSNVQQVSISFYMMAGMTSGNIAVNDFVVLSGALDVTGGVGYDYRVTYYNGNTGWDSNPSQAMITQNWVFPVRQGVQVSWVASADPQVTHVNVWRRGGTLPNAWYRVGRVAIGTTIFTDTIADSVAVEASQLEIDHDRPVTSTLQAPVSTALGTSIVTGVQTVTPGALTNIYANQYLDIGTGGTKETVLVESVNSGAGTFTADFQYPHASTELVYGQTRPERPVNLAMIAYERMWLAGDPDNPHILYFSNVQAPEGFSPANTLEIGTPSDPIMALVNLRGQLFVFTLTRIYTIVIVGGNPPFALPTAVKQGLVGSWAWCIGDGVIYYMSFDGPRVFDGSQSIFLGQDTQWVWSGDPLSSGQIPVAGPGDLANSTLAFYHNEVYFCYTSFSRMIWHTQYKRWRNDNVNGTCILAEEDNDTLLVSTAAYIYKDRTGVIDVNGATGANSGIAFSMVTPYFDQSLPKNQKNYVELWLDIDTAGQNVTVSLQFDNGAQSPIPFTVNTATRSRVALSVNNGLGNIAYNMALQVAGTTSSTTNFVTLYAASIRHIVTPERRQSFDTYFQDESTPAYKVMSEGWFMYESYDAGGINVSVFVDGSATAAFTFNLPQASTQAEVRVQFPATKYKIRRIVGTSAGDFKMWSDSFIKWKPVDMSEGWQKAEMKEPV